MTFTTVAIMFAPGSGENVCPVCSLYKNRGVYKSRAYHYWSAKSFQPPAIKHPVPAIVEGHVEVHLLTDEELLATHGSKGLELL